MIKLFFEITVTFNNNLGLFFNDFYFFLFEIYFLIFIIFLLVFFVIIFNQPNKSKLYFGFMTPLISLTSFCFFALVLLLINSSSIKYSIFNGFYYSDTVILLFKLLIVLGAGLFLPFFSTYATSLKSYDFEFFLIFLFSLFSTILLLNSNDLISFFFIIELQSLSFYILVSSKQTSSFSTESGLKYFILGCFSSGLMLFGISLIYGFTGLLSFHDLSLFFSNFVYLINYSALIVNGSILGAFLLLIGLFFKFGAAPFHTWMPDVYEGSPLIITAFLSTLPKLSLTFLIIKLYYYVFLSLFFWFQIFFIIVALVSIVWGSVAAIYQFKIKRLLTYSMITNSGYIFLAFSFFDWTGIYMSIFYLISYLIIMLGLFFCLLSIRDRSTGMLIKKINYLINLVESNSYLSFSILIMLFSIAGIPPLLGFYPKMFLFYFSMKLNFYAISLVFVIFSAVSVFYYIRLIKLMYFNRSANKLFILPLQFINSFIIAFFTLFNVIFFINPNLFFKLIYNLTFYMYL